MCVCQNGQKKGGMGKVGATEWEIQVTSSITGPEISHKTKRYSTGSIENDTAIPLYDDMFILVIYLW